MYRGLCSRHRSLLRHTGLPVLPSAFATFAAKRLGRARLRRVFVPPDISGPPTSVHLPLHLSDSAVCSLRSSGESGPALRSHSDPGKGNAGLVPCRRLSRTRAHAEFVVHTRGRRHKHKHTRLQTHMHAIAHTSHAHARPTSRLAAIADLGPLPLRDQDSDAVALLKLLYHACGAAHIASPGPSRQGHAARLPPLGRQQQRSYRRSRARCLGRARGKSCGCMPSRWSSSGC